MPALLVSSCLPALNALNSFEWRSVVVGSPRTCDDPKLSEKLVALAEEYTREAEQSTTANRNKPNSGAPLASRQSEHDICSHGPRSTDADRRAPLRNRAGDDALILQSPYREALAKMPDSHSVAYWRQRAEEARAAAENMREGEPKRLLLEIADSHDQIARRMEALDPRKAT